MAEQNKRPNKLVKLKEKMQEREELEKNYSYNPFGKGGNGAPMRDQLGNVITIRKGITNNLYKENGNPYEGNSHDKYGMSNHDQGQLGQQFFNNQSNFPNSNLNQQQIMGINLTVPNIYSNFPVIPNYSQMPSQPQMNGFSMVNSSIHNYDQNQNFQNGRDNIYGKQFSEINSLTNLRNFNNNFGQISSSNHYNLNQNNNHNQNQNFKENFNNQNLNFTAPQSNFNNYEKNIPVQVQPNIEHNNPSNFQGNNNYEEHTNQLESHNLQQPSSLEAHSKQMNYQNELKRQIEEKKMKKDEQKRREAELDRQDEEKYKQYLLLKKGQDEQMKLKRSKNL
jgi:hypothetical protein